MYRGAALPKRKRPRSVLSHRLRGLDPTREVGPMNDGRANPAAGCPGATLIGPLDARMLACPASAGLVRTLLRSRLADWGLSHRADDVQLIAGELLANAAEHAAYLEMRVQFELAPDGMRLGVWDRSNVLPVAKPLGSVDVSPDAAALDEGHDDGTGGWGLPIVQALSVRCGVDPTPPRGKWVWSVIAC
ncbi:ATP-binding protein [Spirillospora sp. NPDC000708]